MMFWPLLYYFHITLMFRANSNPIGGGEAEEAASDIQTAKNINISV